MLTSTVSWLMQNMETNPLKLLRYVLNADPFLNKRGWKRKCFQLFCILKVLWTNDSFGHKRFSLPIVDWMLNKRLKKLRL